MKWYKKAALVLAGILCLGSVACKSKNTGTDNQNPQITVPVQPVSDRTQHYMTGGLHKVIVTESSRKFIADASTEYKIILGGNSSELTEAAMFLRKYTLKATGATLNIEYYTQGMSYDANSKYIVLGCPELFAAAGLTMPSDYIGQTGYYIKTAGDSVFMQTAGVYGYQNAVIAFMRHVLGYEMYSENIVVFDKTGETLPDIDIVEKPDFEFRIQGDKASKEAVYGMGFMEPKQIFIPVEGKLHHNTFAFLPPEKYKKAHPDWYATDGTQLCYTAHGDESEYEIMVDTVYLKIVELLAERPNVGNITFTQEDIATNCDCEACSKILEDYNGCISAAIIKFCNALSRKVQGYLEQQATQNGTEKRDFNIMFFAYQRSEKPPVVSDGNGGYKPIDESVVCDDNVGVYLAPIRASYNKSFYHDDNSSSADNVKAWGACAKKLYMWLYETNFHYYFYPLNSYDTMGETYRFCFERGAIYMMNEGQFNQPSVTHFSRLKEYFDAKAEFDVNVNFNDVANAFFENYFKEAAEPMRKFFDELQAQLRYIEELYPAEIDGTIYNNMAQSRFWPKRMLDHWLELCDEAYTAIEPYKSRDPEMYGILRSNILLETIFPRYALIELHPGKYGAEEMQRMQSEFKKDANELNILYYRESGSIEEIYSKWNV